MRPAKVGTDAVGDALLGAFRRHGYAGSSLRDLAEATGLKSASLYHRFGDGKAAMASAALARAGAAFARDVLAPLAGDAPAAERLSASAEGVARFYDDGALACLLAVMTLSGAPAPIHAEVAGMFGSWRRALGGVLAQAGAVAADDEAEDRIAAVQGALILRRGDAASTAFARAVVRMGARP